jgi:uncharacterized protein YggL (DUF469 family)
MPEFNRIWLNHTMHIVTFTDQPQPTPLTQQQRRLNRRQRKKKRLGEFQEWGLSICAHLVGCDTDAEMDAFIDTFLTLVESQNLMFGGGFGTVAVTKLDGVLAKPGRGSMTLTQAGAILTWLAADSRVSDVINCTWIDLWHGND